MQFYFSNQTLHFEHHPNLLKKRLSSVTLFKHLMTKSKRYEAMKICENESRCVSIVVGGGFGTLRCLEEDLNAQQKLLYVLSNSLLLLLS